MVAAGLALIHEFELTYNLLIVLHHSYLTSLILHVDKLNKWLKAHILNRDD